MQQKRPSYLIPSQDIDCLPHSHAFRTMLWGPSRLFPAFARGSLLTILASSFPLMRIRSTRVATSLLIDKIFLEQMPVYRFMRGLPLLALRVVYTLTSSTLPYPRRR